MAGLNWPGLLAWSTKYHDGTAPSQFKQMSDEDREFLRKAMEEAFGQVEDPNEVMKQAISQITAEDRTDESVLTALEVIDKCCDDPDCARNVEKLSGLQPLLDLLASHEGPIRSRTLEILALLFANNPNIQKAGVKRGSMSIFFQLMKDAPKSSEERGKAFRAVVALVRQVQEYEDLFRTQGGMSLLVECLDPEEHRRTREKAASFAGTLAQDGCLQAEDVGPLAVAIVPLIHALPGEENIQYRETLAYCASDFMQGHPEQCPPALTTAVKARVAELDAAGDPEFETELSTFRHCLAAPADEGGSDIGSAAAAAAAA